MGKWALDVGMRALKVWRATTGRTPRPRSTAYRPCASRASRASRVRVDDEIFANRQFGYDICC
ncbi:MAG: hypothetical protein ABI336_01115 [Humibacillus sp.]